MNTTHNVLIVGVGGQGVLLASEVLSSVSMEAGFDTKKSEVHGMAQRGGVVSSHVRFGEKVYSALIKEGEADVILAFEQAEAQRWIHFLRPEGSIIINKYKLFPPIASMKGFDYPEDPIGAVKKRTANVTVVEAVKLANGLGNSRLVNTILLGVLSLRLDIPTQIWEKVISERVPKGTEKLNITAFQEGRSQQ
ncbi:indolepyruvate oxidoreductase subunit beta [bacterium]|nr:indolepyruvate oxidoreductase subunit beta [bacterium]